MAFGSFGVKSPRGPSKGEYIWSINQSCDAINTDRSCLWFTTLVTTYAAPTTSKLDAFASLSTVSTLLSLATKDDAVSVPLGSYCKQTVHG